jgi:hypothetical protein
MRWEADNEWEVGKDMEGDVRILSEGTTPETLRTTSVRIAGRNIEIPKGYVDNRNPERYPYIKLLGVGHIK